MAVCSTTSVPTPAAPPAPVADMHWQQHHFIAPAPEEETPLPAVWSETPPTLGAKTHPQKGTTSVCKKWFGGQFGGLQPCYNRHNPSVFLQGFQCDICHSILGCFPQIQPSDIFSQFPFHSYLLKAFFNSKKGVYYIPNSSSSRQVSCNLGCGACADLIEIASDC